MNSVRKKRMIRQPLRVITLTVAMVLMFSVPVFAAGNYQHDPMENPKAAADIVENPDAVYGYSPSPESTRLKEYVEYDWSDEKVVNEMREQREAYHESIQELYDMIDSMKAEGKEIEEIARAVSTRRNELRLEAYKDDPEGLEKALSMNAGADACLGLYDKYYDTYMIPEEDAKDSDGSSDEKTYTVKSGDSLWKIAKNELADRTLWESIYELNQDTVKNPRLIFLDQVLMLP